MARFSFLPAASADYEDAFEWYYDRSPRAAVGFEEAVDQAIREIVEAPDRWPVCDPRHRFHLVNRYPYSIVYRVEADLVVVVAVAHGRRQTKYWRGR